MKTKRQIYESYKLYLAEPLKDVLTTAELARRCNISESTVRRWRRGQNIPTEPITLIESHNGNYNKQRTYLRNKARRLSDGYTRLNQHKIYMSFEEVAEILGLTIFQTKVIYLNALRKLKIGFEKNGIDLGSIPEEVEDICF